MIIDDNLLQSLHDQAKNNPRLRQNLDLRTSQEDTSQRMLNFLLPGTEVPIHRHTNTTETIIILKGSIIEVMYDENGEEIARYKLSHNSGNYALQIPKGQWHTVIVEEPCAIIETKDGVFTPLSSEDIWNK